MANQRIEVQPGPDLIEVVSTLGVHENVQLAEQNNLGVVIDSISTTAYVLPDESGGYLAIDSTLTGGPGFGRALEGQSENDFETDLSSYTGGLEVQRLDGAGVYYYYDREMESPFIVGVAGLIMQAGQDSWSIRTRGDGLFSLGNEEPRVDWIEHITNTHIRAVNATINAAYSRAYELQWANQKKCVVYLGGVALQEADEGEAPIDAQKDAFDTFVGIDHVIRELRDAAEIATMTQEECDEYGIERIQSILFYGPSGTGKTELSRAFGALIGAEMDEITLSRIQSAYVGGWANSVDELFEEAYKSDGKKVLFFDEADGLLTTGNSDSTSNVTAVLKKQLEKIKDHPNVFVVFATNNLEQVDENIRAAKRIPLQIGISPPNQDQRFSVLEKFLVSDVFERVSEVALDDVSALVRADASVRGYDLGDLAKRTDGFSVADLRTVVSGVRRRNVLDAKREGRPMSHPTQDQIIAAIDRHKRA